MVAASDVCFMWPQPHCEGVCVSVGEATPVGPEARGLLLSRGDGN